MPTYSLPIELSQAPIKQIGFKVIQLMPIGQDFNLFELLKDKIVKPYFTNAQLNDVEFQILMQYDLNNDYMINSFYRNIETFLLNEGIIIKESNNVFKTTPKAIEVRKFKSYEDFENPVIKEFRDRQSAFNMIVGRFAIAGVIVSIIGTYFTAISYYDNRNSLLNKSSLDTIYLQNPPVRDTILIRQIYTDTLKK